MKFASLTAYLLQLGPLATTRHLVFEWEKIGKLKSMGLLYGHITSTCRYIMLMQGKVPTNVKITVLTCDV